MRGEQPAAATGTARAGGRLFRIPDPRRASRGDWEQLVRFCVVGTSGYVVNLAVFTTLVHLAGAHYVGAAVGAFLVAWTNNFVLNKYWTFRRHGISVWNQAARYLIVSAIALGLNIAFLHFLIRSGLAEVPAQALAIAAVTPVSFLLTRRWALV